MQNSAFYSILRMKEKRKKLNKLLSINYKFFKQEPQKLIEIINKYNKNRLIQGFEIAVSKQEEQKYLLWNQV